MAGASLRNGSTCAGAACKRYMTMSTASLRADADRPNSLTSTAWEDIVGGLFKSELWGRMAWPDVKRRYQRTTLGPLWNSATRCRRGRAAEMA
jgi:hypothetical protein